MPDLEAATLYPGIGCLEASNLSVGRGTPHPFGWIGAPWLKPAKVLKRLKKAKLPGIRFEAKTYTPTKSVFKGKKSRGIRMIITDRNKLKSLAVFAHLVTALRDTHPQKFEIRPERMTLMTGTPEFTQLYWEKAGPREILKLFESDSNQFANERAPFLLY